MILFSNGLEPNLWTYCIEDGDSIFILWINYWGA